PAFTGCGLDRADALQLPAHLDVGASHSDGALGPSGGRLDGARTAVNPECLAGFPDLAAGKYGGCEATGDSSDLSGASSHGVNSLRYRQVIAERNCTAAASGR